MGISLWGQWDDNARTRMSYVMRLADWVLGMTIQHTAGNLLRSDLGWSYGNMTFIC
jgi:hypothetical protein